MAGVEDVRNGRKARQNNSFPNSAIGLWEAFQRFWAKSYAGDYLGLAVLVLLYTLLKLFGEPFHRLFRLNDPRLQHPHADVERVSVFYLFLYSVLFPTAVLALWTLLVRRDLHKAHVSLLGLGGTIVLTAFLTDVFKDAVGRPRPDLIARCSPDAAAALDKLVGVDICTEKRHHLLHDGWRSFPSGHSSLAFAGLGWLAMFFASQTKILRPGASLITVLLCLAPLVGAGLVACSRLEDYRHDVFDVTVGSVLGFTVALFNWRRYYPSLRVKGCDEPYSNLSTDGGFRKVRDEEEGLAGDSRYGIGDEGDA